MSSRLLEIVGCIWNGIETLLDYNDRDKGFLVFYHKKNEQVWFLVHLIG